MFVILRLNADDRPRTVLLSDPEGNVKGSSVPGVPLVESPWRPLEREIGRLVGRQAKELGQSATRILTVREGCLAEQVEGHWHRGQQIAEEPGPVEGLVRLFPIWSQPGLSDIEDRWRKEVGTRLRISFQQLGAIPDLLRFNFRIRATSLVTPKARDRHDVDRPTVLAPTRLTLEVRHRSSTSRVHGEPAVRIHQVLPSCAHACSVCRVTDVVGTIRR